MAEVDRQLGTNYLYIAEGAESVGQPKGVVIYRITLLPEASEADFEEKMESILRTVGGWAGHIGPRITQYLLKEDSSAPEIAAMGRFEEDVDGNPELNIGSMSKSDFREVLSFS